MLGGGGFVARENVLRAVAESESSFEKCNCFLKAMFLFKINSAAYHSKGLDMKNSKMSMFYTKTAKKKKYCRLILIS